MFVDPNQVNPYNKVFGGPNNTYNDLNTFNILNVIIKTTKRKQKIEKIYGLEKTT
jgi:hypothetical protein